MDPKSHPISRLPNEIWDLILQDFDLKTLATVRRVCKLMKQVVLPSSFFRWIPLKNTKESALALQGLADSVESACYVKELEFQISQPEQGDLDNCQYMISRNHDSARVLDLKETLYKVLFDSNSERVFKCLEKFTIRLPAEYHHPIKIERSSTSIYEGMDIAQQYRYSLNMYLGMIMNFISRWSEPHGPTREIMGAQDQPPSPVTVEFINFSPQSCHVPEYSTSTVPSVKHVKFRLCPGFVFQGSRELQTPLQTQAYWTHFRPSFGSILQDCFPNVETVHLSGWWDQNSYHYFRSISDMSLSSTILSSYIEGPLRTASLTLENMVLYEPRLYEFPGTGSGTLRTLKLKNCTVSTGDSDPGNVPAYYSWAKALDRCAEGLVGKNFELRIESADGVEGHFSAFKRAMPTNGAADLPSRQLHGMESTWQEAYVEHEDGAADAYWEFKNVMATGETAN